jgi:hypothetical protein
VRSEDRQAGDDGARAGGSPTVIVAGLQRRCIHCR